MKKVLFIIHLFLIYGCMTQSQTFDKISKKISDCQLTNGIRKKGFDHLHEVRLKLYLLNKLSFLKSEEESFFLETYDVESGVIYGLIWNKKGKINYSYSKNKFSFDDLRFNKDVINLVQNWDVNSIRYKEKNGNLNPNAYIYANHVTLGKNNYLSTECICFREFFELSSDK
jgi:hypothetical protein